MSLAQIFIEDLEINAILGVYEHERETPQRVLVNLVLWVDIRSAARSDDLGDAVDYEALTHKVIARVQLSHYQLVERLVVELAKLILGDYPAVAKVKVRVDKPDALPYTRTVGIELVKSR